MVTENVAILHSLAGICEPYLFVVGGISSLPSRLATRPYGCFRSRSDQLDQYDQTRGNRIATVPFTRTGSDRADSAVRALADVSDQFRGRRPPITREAWEVGTPRGEEQTNRETGLLAALHASGPAGELESELHTFGQFVGSWDLHWYSIPDGPMAHGELHVGWVLGGRAIQDVWIVPGPGQPGAGVPPHAFHGSTLRFFDVALGAWRSTWMEPVNGRVRKFIGREQDGDIVLVSLGDEPLLRWRFTDIGPDAFTWLGEYSTDEARTWHIEERMDASRRAATPDD